MLTRSPDRKTVTSFPARAALRPIALIFMAAGVLFTAADPDLWGHVRFGLDILDSGRVVTQTDPYSFTASRPFVYHEWLGGTVMALAYRQAGPLGLQLLKAALGAALFGLLWAELRRVTFVWRWTGLALAAAGLLPLLGTVRPQLWSALGVVIVTRVLLSSSRGILLALPPIFALWANLHGGWIVGGAIMAIFTMCSFIRQDSRRWLLLITGLVSLIATLATPYGVTLWSFLAETVRSSRRDIAEWQPMWRAGWDSVALWIATVVLFVFSVRRYGVPLATAIVAIVLALAAAMVNRISPLFMIVVVSLLARQWPREAASVPFHIQRTIVDGLAVAVAVAVLVVMRAPQPCIALQSTFALDTVAAEALRGRSGRLVTFFDWGEYALWQFGPALQVSIDGRREAIYREATLRAQQEIAEGTPLGLKTLEQMQADYVWLPAWSPVRTWLQSHGYRMDIVSDRSFVATRSDHPPLQEWRGQSSGCFPGP
jgi:hypothetical protein